jgi:putative transposase
VSGLPAETPSGLARYVSLFGSIRPYERAWLSREVIASYFDTGSGHWIDDNSDGSVIRFLVHDRDRKVSHAVDEIFRTEGIRVIRTPVQAPNANAHAERWVRTHRADCLDRIFLGRRHLEHVLRIYRRHYNEHRPHRAPHLLPPSGRDPTPLNAPDRVQRRDLLGGLIHECRAAA